MNIPQTLDGSPVGAGLWPAYVADGAVYEPAWLRAVHDSGFVGNCTCGGYLRPRRPEKVGSRTDYAAVCVSCSKEIDAPGGRLAKPKRRTKTGG